MISAFFINRPVLANVLAILFVLIGGVSLYRLPVAQYPNVVPTTVQVTARYPGASAQTVIDTVALPIELQVNGVDRMIYMQSTSAADGTYVLTVTFQIGTDPDQAQVLVQNRVQAAMAALPPPVQTQGVVTQKKSTAILQIVALSSPDNRYDGLFMRNYATINLVNELARVPGVGNVNVFGAGVYSMRVWLDPQKMRFFGLQPSDVIRAIKQQSQDVAAGQTGMPPAPATQDFQYTIDIQSQLKDPEQFAAIVVQEQTNQGGKLVYLRDVARLELGAQTYSQDFRLDNTPSAGIAIFQTPEANSLAVAKAVAAKMAALSAQFPQGLIHTIPYDTTLFVQASISEVYQTLLIAGVLVLVVILVFLQNLRATLVPATTVPVTIIGAFAGMAAMGFTVNLSTLFGIVLAIGIVVDDAIVIVEGVSKYIEQGMSGHDAAIKAMDELFGPIIGITLVLMAVFLPAAFLPGLTGNMFAQFALVIAVTALISAVNAATLKPTQCAMWLRAPRAPDKQNMFARGFNAVYARMENGYGGLIGRMARHSHVIALIGVIAGGMGVYGVARLPTAFIPNEDQGYLLVSVQLPDGAALGRTKAALEKLTEIGRATPGVSRVFSIAGVSVLDNSASLANAGVAYVMLKPWGERGKAQGQDLRTIAIHIQDAIGSIPDGFAFVVVPPPIQGIGNAGGLQLEVEMLGGNFDYAFLDANTQRLLADARKAPEMARLVTTFRPTAPQVTLTVDRERAQTLRVAAGDVFSTLTDYVGSSFVNLFNKFGQTLQVYVQADSQFRLQPDDLMNMYVRSSDGQMVPISALATLVPKVAPALITLYNVYPSATIIGQPAAGYSTGQGMAVMEHIAAQVLPKGVGYEWSAMSYQEKIVGNQLYIAFALSVLLVYLCLAGQYESWLLPFAVVFAVPLSLLGPALALAAVGLANNLYTQIGLMLLVALSAKNGILIVEVAREHRASGAMSILAAAVAAARSRFRPILMTSFAFILGVVPLLTAHGAGAAARVSLGLCVFSGMLASTCLAVLFVPSFFVLLQGWDERLSGRGAEKT